MIKRIPKEIRKQLKKKKEEIKKLDKLIKALIAKGTITPEDLK